MIKTVTPSGYLAYKVTKKEIEEHLQSFVICDDCNCDAASGYLVPVLNWFLCESCFEDWAKRNTEYYPEDVDMEAMFAVFYEQCIPITHN